MAGMWQFWLAVLCTLLIQFSNAEEEESLVLLIRQRLAQGAARSDFATTLKGKETDRLSVFEKAQNDKDLSVVFVEPFEGCPASDGGLALLCSERKLKLGIDADEDTKLLESPNGEYALFYTLKGKLVVKQTMGDIRTFESNPLLKSTHVEFKNDGSISLYDGDAMVWASVPDVSSAACNGAIGKVTNEGHLVVDCLTDNTDLPIWTSDLTYFAPTVRSPQVPGGGDVTFYPSRDNVFSTWYSPDKHCKLIFDGSLTMIPVGSNTTLFSFGNGEATSMVLSHTGNVELKKGAETIWKLTEESLNLPEMVMAVRDTCQLCILNKEQTQTLACSSH